MDILDLGVPISNLDGLRVVLERADPAKGQLNLFHVNVFYPLISSHFAQGCFTILLCNYFVVLHQQTNPQHSILKH